MYRNVFAMAMAFVLTLGMHTGFAQEVPEGVLPSIPESAVVRYESFGDEPVQMVEDAVRSYDEKAPLLSPVTDGELDFDAVTENIRAAYSEYRGETEYLQTLSKSPDRILPKDMTAKGDMWEVESNDSMALADWFNIGDTLHGSITGSNSDIDYYKVTCPSRCRICLDAYFDNYTCQDLVIVLLNQEGGVIEFGEYVVNEFDWQQIDSYVDCGTKYMAVFVPYDNPVSYAGATYSIFTDSYDQHVGENDFYEVECNDSINIADPITDDINVFGTMTNSVEDLDCYSFHVDQIADFMAVLVTEDSLVASMDFMLLDGDGDFLEASWLYTEENVKVIKTEILPGDYYMVVFLSDQSNLDAIEKLYLLGYSLDNGFNAEADDYFENEPNNDASSANPLRMDKYTWGTITGSPEDLDYYSFALEQYSNLEIIAAMPMYGDQLIVGIENQNGDLIDVSQYYADPETGYEWQFMNTALPPGSYNLIVLKDSGNSDWGCSYFVYANLVDASEYVSVTGIDIGDYLEIEAGKSLSIDWTIQPADASNTGLVWTSSNPSVAEVSNYGTVMAKQEGTAEISAVTDDGGFTDTCHVEVVPSETVTGQGGRRVLIVANYDYPGAENDLYGPPNDAARMETVMANSRIGRFNESTDSIVTLENATSLQLENAIQSAFADSGSDSTLTFYYSGHGGTGTEGAYLCMMDGSYTASRLENTLSAYSGTKVIILDSCFSGGFIAQEVGDESGPETYNSQFVEAFSSTISPQSTLNQNGYKVITACSGSQVAYEANGIGLFTEALAEGMGYGGTGLADADKDSDVSLQEAYEYALGAVESSDVQIYPYGDRTIVGGGFYTEGDLFSDGAFDLADLARAAMHFGDDCDEFEKGDINRDLKVDLYDLVLLAKLIQ